MVRFHHDPQGLKIMSETVENQETASFQSEEINDINSGLVKYLHKILKEYPSIKELLGKGKLDFGDPTRTLETLNWEYTFARLVPEYLQLSIIKRPKSHLAIDTGIVEQRVDIVCGDKPLIQHDITQMGKLKLPPDKNTPQAVKKFTDFVSELEPQL